MIKSQDSSDKFAPKRRVKTSKQEKTTSDLDTADSDSSFNSALEQQEGRGFDFKDYYYTSLLICFAGVISCYTGYAVLQESLLSDKSKKMNTNFVMGVQSLFAVLISTSIIKFFRMGPLFEGFSRGDLTVGTLNFCTMYCSNFALKFVNYPFMALAKSAKILPVILTGWLTGVYKLQRSQVLIAITISAGLVIFNAKKVSGGFADDSLFGIGLVIMSLLFDGFVNSQTDKNHQAKKDRDYAYHTMLYNNMVGLVGNAIFFAFACIYQEENTLQRVLADPSILREVIMIALCGAIGQIFIFLTISLHDCYKLSIMTTSRKCLTVVISAIAFNHAFTPVQWFGASLVLTSTIAEVYLGNKRKRERMISSLLEREKLD